MSNKFSSFATTTTGRELIEIIEEPERVAEYFALTRLGRPAVQAVAERTRALIEALPLYLQHTANQFVGWSVAQLMRRLGCTIARERAPVKNGTFKAGAVWNLPSDEPQVVRSLPKDCGRRVEVNAVDPMKVEVTAVYSAANPTRRIHTFVQGGLFFDDALQLAKDYARSENYSVIWLRDYIDFRRA